MQYNKVELDLNFIDETIKNVFNSNADNLLEIEGGEIARTFKFNISEKSYYIQFNHSNMSGWASFEMRNYDRFQKQNVPVRKVVHQAYIKEIHYAVTEEVTGIQPAQFNIEEIKNILPQAYQIIKNISKIDISNTSGYGWIDKSENGIFHTWKEHIDFVMQEEPDDMFYGKWYNLFDTTFLQRDVFENYYHKMTELYPYLPEQRFLQHGNFSMANIIVDKNRISGVIDWQDVRYGDSLFDFTHFIFWLSEPLADYITQNYYKYLQTENENIKNFVQRIKCYKYYFALDAL